MGREMRMVVKDLKSVLRNVDNGVPQGSVLAAILFMYSKTSLLLVVKGMVVVMTNIYLPRHPEIDKNINRHIYYPSGTSYVSNKFLFHSSCISKA